MRKSSIVFMKFGLVGMLNTLIDLILFAICIKLDTDYITAQFVSYSCGLFHSYLVNKSWTFKSKTRIHGREIAKFIVINLITFLLTIGLLTLFKQKTDWDLLVIKLFATAVGMVVNFIGSKLWVFVEEKKTVNVSK